MSWKSGLVIAVTLLVCVAVAVLAQEKPDREVSEKLIGKIDVSEVIGHSLRASPDAKRFAYVASSGCTWWVVVDARKGKEYQKLAEVGVLGERDRCAVSFSPDGKRVAYSVYERIDSDGVWEEDPKTPDKRVYVTKRWGKMRVIVDEQEREKYDVVKYVTFSPDSKRIVYVAGRSGKEFVVVDDNEEKQYDSVRWPVFSPDSKRLAYVASVKRKDGPLTTTEHFVVVDGKEGEHYDDHATIWDIVFSPDSKRVAYPVDMIDRDFVVVDGIPEKAHEHIGVTPVFSPDSRRIAYRVTKYDSGSFKSFIVLDGKEQNLYDAVGPFSEIVFSPDSKRLAYKARAEGKWFLVADGKEGKRYDYVGGIVFSPDGKRLAYCACAGEKELVVVDADEGKQYDTVGGPEFSPDGKSVAYLAETGDKWFVVVNGKEGKEYDRILSKIIFDSDNALHYLVLSGNSVYLVEEKLE